MKAEERFDDNGVSLLRNRLQRIPRQVSPRLPTTTESILEIFFSIFAQTGLAKNTKHGVKVIPFPGLAKNRDRMPG
ncbi:MAG: hypothetical protein ACOZF0_09945 [Thermodesulfobacteriota bacterium]